MAKKANSNLTGNTTNRYTRTATPIEKKSYSRTSKPLVAKPDKNRIKRDY